MKIRTRMLALTTASLLVTIVFAAKMFSAPGIGDARSSARCGEAPSFENRRGVPRAAEQSVPEVNHNRNRLVARSSRNFEVTVPPTRPHSFTFFRP